ncbi:MAG: hypothetical protein ACP5UC_01290 [Candidatus Micrarchaeia archaeon]
MKYYVRLNKRVKYVKVCHILKPLGEKTNFMTKLFMKLLKVKPEEGT